VVRQRTEYLSQLQELLRDKQQLFFEKDNVLSIGLQSSFAGNAAEVQIRLEKNLEREVSRGICLLGVHRDEVKMTVNGKELRKFGSSGQHRAYLLLLLLAQLELYERLRSDRPVLLLDDLDSELDQKKIRSFLNEIGNRYQTLISSSRPELFEKQSGTRFFEIQAGRLLES